MEKIEELLGKIHDQETKHKMYLDPEESRQIDILRIELSECLNRRNFFFPFSFSSFFFVVLAIVQPWTALIFFH